MGNCVSCIPTGVRNNNSATSSSSSRHQQRASLSLSSSSAAAANSTELQQMIKVVTSSGGIMELYAPITADSITEEFPGHRLFPSPDLLSPPLFPSELLIPGKLYYLLPTTLSSLITTTRNYETSSSGDFSSPRLATPYRVSFDSQRMNKRRTEDLPVRRRSSRRRGGDGGGGGVWKVRLVINPEQLTDILSEEASTQELIESVRTVAKWGAGGGAGGSAPVAGGYDDYSGGWKHPADSKYG